MTYVELIVVLGIFSTLAAVVLFKYGDFQNNVDIKNLAGDIALQIVTAQKVSLSGLLPQGGAPFPTWKPSYGVYFNPANFKQFIYFVDLSNPSNGYNIGEELSTVSITKNNSISRIDSYVGSAPTQITNPLSVTFKRPSSGPVFCCSNGIPLTGFDYVQITVASQNGVTKAYIKLYPSGRIQIN